MYGHVFYKSTSEKQAEFLNSELQSGKFNSLEELADSMFIHIDDIKAELWRGGYLFVSELNKFVRYVLNDAC